MKNTLTRRAMLATAAVGPFIRTSRAAARRPNFLFLLTDDQSYASMSITGSSFMKTPNIDRIGHGGVLFTRGLVAMSLCAPSRACFLTGLYPHKNGIINNQIRWNQNLQTLPRLLQSNGWRTAHIGKFHMDGDDRVQPGYDYWAAQIGQGSYVDPRKNINGTWTDLKGYDTTIITDQAIEFMRAGKDKPFCTWLAYKACHGPFTPAPGHEHDFVGREFKPPASFFIDDEGKSERVRNKSQRKGIGAGHVMAGKKNKKNKRRGAPVDDDGPGAAPATLEAWAERERNQHRSLMGVEDSVKRIWQFLDEEKLTDDTIIFYSGDNGFFHGEHGLHGKLEPYEESIRVPMMLHYPRLIKAGQECDAMIANIDMAPSILDLCGVKAPLPMQGQSWVPFVTGNKALRRDSFVYSLHRQDAAQPWAKALRTERYKLILNLFPQDKDELYDLQTDPQEMKNLALDNNHRELVLEMKRTLLFQMKKIEDPAVPTIEATLKP